MYFQVPNVILSKSKTTTIIRTGTNVIKSNHMHAVMTDAQTPVTLQRLQRLLAFHLLPRHTERKGVKNMVEAK